MIGLACSSLPSETEWTVGYEGDVKHHRKQFNVSKVAGLFAKYLSRVIGTEV